MIRDSPEEMYLLVMFNGTDLNRQLNSIKGREPKDINDMRRTWMRMKRWAIRLTAVCALTVPLIPPPI